MGTVEKNRFSELLNECIIVATQTIYDFDNDVKFR